MSQIVNWNNDIYNIPAYSVTDAARYLRIPVGTLRSWLQRRSYLTKDGKQYSQPLIERPDAERPQISFTNLVEAHMLRSIRKIHGVRLDQVRKALDYLDQQFGLPHPLARIEFQTNGVDLFVDSVEQLVGESKDEQLTLRGTSKNPDALESVNRIPRLFHSVREVVNQGSLKSALNHLLTRVEWDEQGLATRLFPSSSTTPTAISREEPRVVAIDPRLSFGRPVIAGISIPTQAIAERYEAGESPESIAYDYDCDLSQVHDAIRFELSLSHAA